MTRHHPERIDERHSVDPRAESTDADFHVFGRDQIRAVDHAAIHEFGIPGIVLMENASRHAADVCLDLLEGIGEPFVLICCGPGNNGGDGLAVARHLVNAGVPCQLVLTHPPERYEGDARINLEIAQRMAIPMITLDPAQPTATLAALDRADLVVDAMLGTGLDRELGGVFVDVVNWINQERKTGQLPMVLAIDIPTGMDCDTGRVLGACVTADVTITFVGLKRGFLELDAQARLGEVYVGDIGAPSSLCTRFGELVALTPRPGTTPSDLAEDPAATRRQHPGAEGQSPRN
jgi:hydroxyethylthiazole kinase-like uncharacterized protein yjeF